MQSNFWCLILLLILLLVFTVNSTLPLNLIIWFFKFNLIKNRIYTITLFQLKAICTCTPDSAKSRGHNSLRVQIRMHCYSLQWVGESVQSHWQTQVRNSGDFRANCTKLEFHVKSSKCSFSHEFHENKEHFMLSCFMVKWFVVDNTTSSCIYLVLNSLCMKFLWFFFSCFIWLLANLLINL